MIMILVRSAGKRTAFLIQKGQDPAFRGKRNRIQQRAGVFPCEGNVPVKIDDIIRYRAGRRLKGGTSDQGSRQGIIRQKTLIKAGGTNEGITESGQRTQTESSFQTKSETVRKAGRLLMPEKFLTEVRKEGVQAA